MANFWGIKHIYLAVFVAWICNVTDNLFSLGAIKIPPLVAQAPGLRPAVVAQAPRLRPAVVAQAPRLRPAVVAQAPRLRPAVVAQAPRLRLPVVAKAPGLTLPQQCDIDNAEKITCGEPGTGAAHCTAINCCFDGQQCYYGKMVTVQCTRDGQFVLVVAKDATLPRLSLDSISLLGGSAQQCGPVDSTAAYVIYQFPVTACGTNIMQLGDYVVYENKMLSSYEVGVGPYGSITRDSHYELYFQCRYSAVSVEALVVDHFANEAPLPVVAFGPLRVELRLGNGRCATKGCVPEQAAYTSYYNQADYPVTKVLREPVYVEVRILGRSDPNIVLTLGRCWATSSPEPFIFPQWDLLVNGCPYQDDHYLTTLVAVDGSGGLQFPRHYRRFVFKMLTFVDPASLAPLQERVFVHCRTAVCQPTASVTCEPRCSRKRRDVSEAEWTFPHNTVIVSSREVIVTQM